MQRLDHMVAGFMCIHSCAYTVYLQHITCNIYPHVTLVRIKNGGVFFEGGLPAWRGEAGGDREHQ